MHRPSKPSQLPGSDRPNSTCVGWYSEGESMTVEVSGVRVNMRFIGRKGRRARIAITAPAGAKFVSVDFEPKS